MVLSRVLAAAGISLLAVAGAAACDDYDEEMALQAARNAGQLARAQADSVQSAAAVAPSAPAQSAPTEIAVLKPPSAPPR